MLAVAGSEASNLDGLWKEVVSLLGLRRTIVFARDGAGEFLSYMGQGCSSTRATRPSAAGSRDTHCECEAVRWREQARSGDAAGYRTPGPHTHWSGYDAERAVFLTVLHRLTAPGSDRSALAWMADQAFAGGDLQWQHLYRAMA